MRAEPAYMDYQAIIDKYYPDDDDLRQLLIKHSRQVADRCLEIDRRHPELQLDRQFLEEAAMLHDIGIRWCHAPSIYCYGTEPYICHGIIGARVLRDEGWDRHALVCERHTGTGLTREEIVQQALPLPPDGNYEPQALEEQLVCYADKFYSKSHSERQLTVLEAAQSLERFGEKGVQKFLNWAAMFE